MTKSGEQIGRRRFLAATGGMLAAGAAGLQSLEANTAPELPGPLGEVSHLGWVVKDIDSTVGYWSNIGRAGYRSTGSTRWRIRSIAASRWT